MIPIRDLFEAHLTVTNLQRSMSFFGDALGLELAQVFSERKVAFYWTGRRGEASGFCLDARGLSLFPRR
jgi:lactoylglutathione lyase